MINSSTTAMPQRRRQRAGLLVLELRWLIQLRWVTAVVCFVAALIDLRFGWFHQTPVLVGTGAAVAAYNAALWATLSYLQNRLKRRHALLLLAWTQLLLDLVCLTVLTVTTGGPFSPVSTFFVFHMVFASILLPRTMAYATPAAAVVMLAVALKLAGEWPQSRQDLLLWAGRALTLFLTVYLANHLTRALRRNRRRLARQNQRVRRMAAKLKRQQEAMIQHEKMVAMGHMAAGVAHEIANPLASMDSVLQLAQRKPEKLNPATVETLREQVSRIQQTITQMRAFAHPSELQFETLNLNDVVDQALEIAGFDPRFKPVAVQRDYSPHVGSLALLRQAIQQVLVNLLMNALDATASIAEPRITVRTTARDGACLIEVSDNGCGIAPQHMTRLFEPFFTTKPVGKGTGLGLSISYSLVQKHAGSISARSELGRGTTFTIRLPSCRREAHSEGFAGNGKTRT